MLPRTALPESNELSCRLVCEKAVISEMYSTVLQKLSDTRDVQYSVAQTQQYQRYTVQRYTHSAISEIYSTVSYELGDIRDIR